MHTFSFPASILPRLAALHLACATGPGNGALGHIALNIRGDTARFVASDGRLLAMVRTAVTWDIDQAPEDIDAVLDAEQLTTAAAAIAAHKSPSAPVAFALGKRELRITTKHGAHLVKIHELVFPMSGVQGLLTKYSTSAWVPTIATVDAKLMQRAHKFIGIKTTPLMRTPVDVGSSLSRAWNPAVAHQTPESISVQHFLHAANAPALWSDHEILVLIMPITMAAAAPLDLTQWLPSSKLVMAAAAA